MAEIGRERPGVGVWRKKEMAGIVTVEVVESRLKEVVKAQGHVCLF